MYFITKRFHCVIIILEDRQQGSSPSQSSPASTGKSNPAAAGWTSTGESETRVKVGGSCRYIEPDFQSG